MSRLQAAFARARAENRAALIVFITAGDPDMETTAELVPELVRAGADIIELGMPHSDPIAEGPTIQASSVRSLAAGTTPDAILRLSTELRKTTDVPLVLMGYINNVLAQGEERMVQRCASAGIDGLIIVDVPFDDSENLQRLTQEKGVDQILLVAPTSTPERVMQISTRSRGFVYCVSDTGVTGGRQELPRDLGALVGRIQRVTTTPVGVGFGISTPEHAAQVAMIADGVIVGSALVNRIGAASSREEAIVSATAFVRELAEAIRTARH